MSIVTITARAVLAFLLLHRSNGNTVRHGSNITAEHVDDPTTSYDMAPQSSSRRRLQSDPPPPLYSITQTYRLRTVAYSPVGNRLASAGLDRDVKIWDTTNNGASLLHSLTGHNGNILQVEFSPDGTMLASGSHDQTIKIWDMTANGLLLRTLRGHGSVVVSVSFSSDGTMLSSGSNDENVIILDVATGALLHTLEGYTDKVRAVSWSRDMTRVASSSWDATVIVWDLTTTPRRSCIILRGTRSRSGLWRSVRMVPRSRQGRRI